MTPLIIHINKLCRYILTVTCQTGMCHLNLKVEWTCLVFVLKSTSWLTIFGAETSWRVRVRRNVSHDLNFTVESLYISCSCYLLVNQLHAISQNFLNTLTVSNTRGFSPSILNIGIFCVRAYIDLHIKLTKAFWGLDDDIIIDIKQL